MYHFLVPHASVVSAQSFSRRLRVLSPSCLRMSGDLASQAASVPFPRCIQAPPCSPLVFWAALPSHPVLPEHLSCKLFGTNAFPPFLGAPSQLLSLSLSLVLRWRSTFSQVRSRYSTAGMCLAPFFTARTNIAFYFSLTPSFFFLFFRFRALEGNGLTGLVLGFARDGPPRRRRPGSYPPLPPPPPAPEG